MRQRERWTNLIYYLTSCWGELNSGNPHRLRTNAKRPPTYSTPILLGRYLYIYIMYAASVSVTRTVYILYIVYIYVCVCVCVSIVYIKARPASGPPPLSRRSRPTAFIARCQEYTNGLSRWAAWFTLSRPDRPPPSTL